MSDLAIGTICLCVSLVLIQTGMNIGVALLALSFLGVWAIKGPIVAGKLLSSSVATSIANDAYAVIPLFVLMGLFVSVTNIGRDTFAAAALLLRGVRGGLGMATISTLFLTPVAYLLLGRFVTPKVQEEARLKRELEEAAYSGVEPAE